MPEPMRSPRDERVPIPQPTDAAPVRDVRGAVVVRGARAPCLGDGCPCCVELSADFLGFAANFGVRR